MKQLINFQREVWDGYSGNYDTHKIKDVSNTKTVSSNTSDIELGKAKTKTMKAFFDGFKKGLFGTWRFMGENGSVLMLFMSVIEYFRGWYVLSIHSILVAILFAIWDLKSNNND